MSRPRIHEAKHPSPFFSFFLAENFIEAPPVEAIDVVSQLNAEEAAEAAEAADLSNLAAAAAASDTDESVGSSSADVRPLLPQGAANYLSRGLLNEDEALKLILQVSFFPPSVSTPCCFSLFSTICDLCDISRQHRRRRRLCRPRPAPRRPFAAPSPPRTAASWTSRTSVERSGTGAGRRGRRPRRKEKEEEEELTGGTVLWGRSDVIERYVFCHY